MKSYGALKLALVACKEWDCYRGVGGGVEKIQGQNSRQPMMKTCGMATFLSGTTLR